MFTLYPSRYLPFPLLQTYFHKYTNSSITPSHRNYINQCIVTSLSNNIDIYLFHIYSSSLLKYTCYNITNFIKTNILEYYVGTILYKKYISFCLKCIQQFIWPIKENSILNLILSCFWENHNPKMHNSLLINIYTSFCPLQTSNWLILFNKLVWIS